MIPAEYRSLRPSTLLDATCSGDMYWGVPTVVPVLVTVEAWESSARRAIPKSAILTSPSSDISRFSGLTSRWTMLWRGGGAGGRREGGRVTQHLARRGNPE